MQRRGERKILSILSTAMFGLFLTVVVLLTVYALAACTVNPETFKRANLIVQFDDHQTAIRTVHFTTPISGLQALESSGLNVVTAKFDWGTAVCSIESVGCPVDNCFCNKEEFWNYDYWDGHAWQGYPVGASASIISRTGTVEGWRWGKSGSAILPPPRVEAAQDALNWLQARQVITDGGYGNSMGAAVETMLAVGSNRISGDDWRRQPNSPSLLGYLLDHGSQYSHMGVAEAGKLAVALGGAGGCWPAGAVAPSDYYSPTLHAISDQAGFLSWAILGTLTLTDHVPSDSVQLLLNLAQPQGGWEWSPGWGRDTNTTAVAIQALRAAGEPVTSTVIVSGVAFLKSAQNPDGGFPYDPLSQSRHASDSDSTAYVVQGLVAAGEDPVSARWTISGSNPISYLLGMKQDDGSFAWQKGQGANQTATQQSIPALLGRAYPLQTGTLHSCAVASGSVSATDGGQINIPVAGRTVTVGVKLHSQTKTLTTESNHFSLSGIAVNARKAVYMPRVKAAQP